MTSHTHQVKVLPEMTLSKIFSATGRVIHPNANILGSVPHFFSTAQDFSIQYTEIVRSADFDQILRFCKENFLVPAHPLLVAADCLARPAFTDGHPVLTLWQIDEALFGYMKCQKDKVREVFFDSVPSIWTDQWTKGMWLATTPAK